MGRLAGRIALITGAGRGIGREEALFFAAEGAKVVVNDPGVAIDGSGGDAGVAAAVVAEIRANGGEAVANTDSVSDWEGARRMVEGAVKAFGDLHVVVNNATIERNHGVFAMTEKDFDDVIAVKLKGTFAVTRWAARHWRARYEAGDRVDRALIHTSSGSGLLNPLPLQSNYAAGNAGVGAMTIVHALELGRYDVRVNCLSPSMVRTRLTLAVPGMQATPREGDYDPVHPIHQAVVAAYLARADCPMTGQVLSVRAGSVAINQGWTRGPRVDRDGSPWTLDELTRALDELPRQDPFEKLSNDLAGAVGVTGLGQLQSMINAMLDNDASSAETS